MGKTLEEFREFMAETPEAEPETKPANAEPSTQAPETEPPASESADPKDSPLPEPEAETPKESTGIKEMLADAGVDIKNLYEAKIPGTDITFGQAKDSAPDLADISRLKLDIQKQRDEQLTKQTEYGNQVNATIGRLVEALGEEPVRRALEQAPVDVEAARQKRDTELKMFRPELADEAKMLEADGKVGELASFYGLQGAAFKSAEAGLTRAFLRLHELESYLDTLREPEKPKKQVRSASKKSPRSRGKTPRKFLSDGKQAYHERLAERE